MSLNNSVVVSVVKMEDGDHVIIVEFTDEGMSLVLPPSLAEAIASTLISAVHTAKREGWVEGDGEQVYVHQPVVSPSKDNN